MSLNQNASIVELCPSQDKPAKYFKEIFVSDVFKIPTQKPDKERVINVKPSVTLEDVETIFVDLPDPGVDGYKVFVAGNVYLDVQYISTKVEQTVHFVRFQLPFETILLEDCGELIATNPGEPGVDYVVHVCVEKVVEKQIDERTILFEVLLLVWAEEV